MRKKEPFRGNGGYGWMDMGPAQMPKQMKKATLRLGTHIKKLKPDALAFCGSSGAALAFIAAVFYEMPLLYVRKPSESSHGSSVECNSGTPIHTYLIIDDFIDTGRTMERIVKGITDHADHMNVVPPECLGAFFYAPSDRRGRFRVEDDFYDIFT